MISGFGTSALGAKGLVALDFTFIWQGESRTSPMVACAHGIKLAESIRGSKTRLFWGMMIALGFSFIGAAFMTLYVCHTYGAVNLSHINWAGGHGWPGMARLMVETPDANMRGWLFKVIGGLGSGFLSWAQHRWFWWPLHPLGFAISVGWLAGHIWFTALLAWLIKLTIMHFGGVRLYPHISDTTSLCRFAPGDKEGHLREPATETAGPFSGPFVQCVDDDPTDEIGSTLLGGALTDNNHVVQQESAENDLDDELLAAERAVRAGKGGTHFVVELAAQLTHPLDKSGDFRRHGVAGHLRRTDGDAVSPDEIFISHLGNRFDPDDDSLDLPGAGSNPLGEAPHRSVAIGVEDDQYVGHQSTPALIRHARR